MTPPTLTFGVVVALAVSAIVVIVLLTKRVAVLGRKRRWLRSAHSHRRRKENAVNVELVSPDPLASSTLCGP